MTATRQWIEHLVLRVQAEFLDNPTLALSPPAAEKRFGLDDRTCAGVLGALADAGVLAKRDGVYLRRFPRPAPRRAA